MENVRYGIHVFGLSRSGHTAIMHWLGAQCRDDYDPTTPDVKKWGSIGATTAIVATVSVNKGGYWPRLVEIQKQVANVPILLIDDQLDEGLPTAIQQRQERFREVFQRRWPSVVIVLRDYRNHWASKWAGIPRGKCTQWGLDRFPPRWLLLAKEVVEPSIPDRVIVRYNEWLTSRPYRKAICESLGLPPRQLDFDYRPFPGSSFDVHDRPEAMLRRWREVPGDKLEAAVTPEILGLSDELFPDVASE